MNLKSTYHREHRGKSEENHRPKGFDLTPALLGVLK